MSERIITISREFGSGGRTVGRMAAKALNIPCYDQEILEELARKSGFTQGYIQEQGEYAAHAGWLSNALASRFSDGLTSQDRLWVLQRELILELAEKGPCVIVGRCADFILREKADCLTAFIHADMSFRAKRIVEVYGQRQDSPPEAAPGQGPPPGGLLPVLHGHPVGPGPELPHRPGQRCAGHRALRGAAHPAVLTKTIRTEIRPDRFIYKRSNR